ncbi:hypothetical protein [Mycobacteroides abscessus]|uniref:hypothetical protein n=1 Tax=Mycobacteroides abscessus TaxID=36809 RepID=UPI0021040B60|nr:hypothetical protein [Mycobacteroides abscessus]
MSTKHVTTRYFAVDGTRPTCLIEVDENYFRECRLAGAAAVEVLTPAGTCEAVCGTRYLQAGTSIAAAVVGGRLEITYEGAILCTVEIGERLTFWPAAGLGA